MSVGKLKYGVFLFFMIVSCACIEQYDAEIDEDHDLICFEASLIRGEERQILKISRASKLLNPELKTVSGCLAMIKDDQNNIYEYIEEAPGVYMLHIPDEAMKFDRLYKLHVITPEGIMYESSWEHIERGAKVDTLYYKVEDKFNNVGQEMMQGIQFYIDIKTSDTLSRFFRWRLTETYEFTSIAPISYYLTGDPIAPSVSLDDEWEYYRCWMTREVKAFFLSSTNNLSVNEKAQIPLYYVNNQTDQLKIKYSLLVKQYPLSSEAYNYWEKVRYETKNSGGLYTRQPGQPICNIANVDDEDEVVLGYFWASEMTKQRIIVPKPPSIEVQDNSCSLEAYDPNCHNAGPFPRYLWIDQVRGGTYTGPKECFNCVIKGGNLEKPDYWDNE